MDLDGLSSSPIGQLVPISGTDARHGDFSYYAYLPHDLPSEPALNQGTWNLVAKANEALGRLRQACNQLPNPALLITPALTREAVDTSALEGTYGTLPDVLEARLPSSPIASPEVREIRAYETMARTAFEWIKDRPISIGMLCELQSILAADSRTPSRDPGMVRQHQVLIGPEGCAIQEARFVPPPPDDRLRSGLEAWQEWVALDHDLPIPVRVALSHYQFETLHPFGDGNGRVGRLLIVLQMMSSGALPAPVLTLSSWLLRRRTEYQGNLLALSMTGDWNPWVRFISQALIDQSEVLVNGANALINWRAEVQAEVNTRKWTGVIHRVVDELIDWPAINVAFAVERFGVSQPTAQNVIDKLVQIGALTELTGRSYNRFYGATTVISIVEGL